MGLLVDGKWQDRWYDTKASGGKFIREDAQFRNWITPDGSAGPTGEDGFKAESGRYHLYVSHACPWAHRTLIFRELKGLTEHIGVSAVHPDMLDQGWTFEKCEGSDGDALYGSQFAHQIYTRAKASYSGRVTVPILWDQKTETIVSNESSEIIRMLNSGFNELTGSTLDFYPAELQAEIDAINERVYHTINNGVYRCGFATSESAYQEAFRELFGALDWVESILTTKRYLTGDRVTEADWRLFTTLIRFDAVYVGHFKCNRQRIADFLHLSGYLRELYQTPGIAETVNFEHIKRHYYVTHRRINPTGVVPRGPEIEYTEPHGRGAPVAERRSS